ncbi:MAG: hypothetical protein Q4C70_04650 [Planctomycetia bacterium]|nr:hypothetical protein [Planctomycetia bacterium]
MFEKTRDFFGWLFGKSEHTGELPISGDAENPLIAWQIPKDGTIAPGQVVSIFDDTRLLDTQDKIPDVEYSETTTFWILPTEDVNVSIQVAESSAENTVGNNTKNDKNTVKSERITTTVKVRFEPEMGLGAFLKGKESVTESELQDVLQSQMIGLMDVLRCSLEQFLKADKSALEAIRAKFSVLLSGNGLRCTGIKPFQVMKVTEMTEMTENHGNIWETGEPEDAKNTKNSEHFENVENVKEMASAAKNELKSAVEGVKNPSEWQEFSQNLAEQGFPMTEENGTSVAEIGSAFLKRQMTAEECVQEICRLAEEVAGEKSVESACWNGLALRMRVMPEVDFDEEERDTWKEQGDQKTQNSAENLPEVKPGRSRRPKKWWIFTRSVRLDERLQDFLREKLESIKNGLREARRNTGDIRVETDFRLMEKTLETIRDLLKSVPQLDPVTPDLQVEKGRFSEILASMNQSVTSAEYVEATLKKGEGLENPVFRKELKEVLEGLQVQLQKRYQVR